MLGESSFVVPELITRPPAAAKEALRPSNSKDITAIRRCLSRLTKRRQTELHHHKPLLQWGDRDNHC